MIFKISHLVEREKMKMTSKITLALLALGLVAFTVQAQDNGGPPDGGPDGGPPQGRGFHHPPPLPLLLALDTNHDGIIDSNEIANASAELLTLDKNGDGQLTTNEYLPPPPPDAGDSGRPFHPPRSPLIEALDVNHDGIIDSNEIANASAELLTLDKNGDGQLTRDEYAPHHRHGMDGPPDGGGSGDDGPPGPPPGDSSGNNDGMDGGPPGPPPNQ
jgi:EF hand